MRCESTLLLAVILAAHNRTAMAGTFPRQDGLTAGLKVNRRYYKLTFFDTESFVLAGLNIVKSTAGLDLRRTVIALS